MIILYQKRGLFDFSIQKQENCESFCAICCREATRTAALVARRRDLRDQWAKSVLKV